MLRIYKCLFRKHWPQYKLLLGYFPCLNLYISLSWCWPLIKIIKIILWNITWFYMNLCVSIRKKGQEYLSKRTTGVSIKYVTKYFIYDIRLSMVCFLQWLFLELLKRFALIRPNGSSTNTAFLKKNWSQGWFLSWQCLRSITFAKNIKEITLGFTLELCVHLCNIRNSYRFNH